jgi:hypothetical protein
MRALEGSGRGPIARLGLAAFRAGAESAQKAQAVDPGSVAVGPGWPDPEEAHGLDPLESGFGLAELGVLGQTSRPPSFPGAFSTGTVPAQVFEFLR